MERNEIQYSIDEAAFWLRRTPTILKTWLTDAPEHWVHANEGGDSWSAYDIVGHLIHGERSDWIQRMEIILNREPDANREFEPFDRFAQFDESKGKSMNDLLIEFDQIRTKNIDVFEAKKINENQLNLEGVHPALGQVTLSQLLSTWVAHDFNHLGQISRVLAKQYKSQTGPWVKYIRLLNS